VAGLFLLTFGVAKMIAGYEDQYALPASVFYSAMVIEVAAGAGLLTGRVVVPSLAGISVGVGGAVFALFRSSDLPCGCLAGLAEYSKGRHLAAALAMIATCAMVLSIHLGSTARKQAGSSA